MTENVNLFHERVDDIPLLIGLTHRLRLPALLDRHLGNHGNPQGLSTGWLTTVWLAYILSEGAHCKSKVEQWVQRHRQTVERLVDHPMRAGEFHDDRLGLVLHRLSAPATWANVETALWHATVAVYEFALRGIRLDSTTTYGYPTVTEEGVMQYGYSTDSRPDVPQVKLMAAAAEPSGHLLACDVHPGQAADDPLSLPLIARVRQMMNCSGLLYVGDCKMAALATRADIVAHGDFYLMPLPLTGEPATEGEDWIGKVGDGNQGVDLIWDEERVLGGGYACERQRSAEGELTPEKKPIEWTERVQVIRSLERATQQAKHREKRLDKAEKAVQALTPAPGRGKRHYRDEAALEQAISHVLEQYAVVDRLAGTGQREEKSVTRYVGRGRGSFTRPQRTEISVRSVMTAVKRNTAALQRRAPRLGWGV